MNPHSFGCDCSAKACVQARMWHESIGLVAFVVTSVAAIIAILKAFLFTR